MPLNGEHRDSAGAGSNGNGNAGPPGAPPGAGPGNGSSDRNSRAGDGRPPSNLSSSSRSTPSLKRKEGAESAGPGAGPDGVGKPGTPGSSKPTTPNGQPGAGPPGPPGPPAPPGANGKPPTPGMGPFPPGFPHPPRHPGEMPPVGFPPYPNGVPPPGLPGAFPPRPPLVSHQHMFYSISIVLSTEAECKCHDFWPYFLHGRPFAVQKRSLTNRRTKMALRPFGVFFASF